MTAHSQWSSYFQDADGFITNPGVNLNSILFTSTTAENAVINFDDVGWTETGAIPVPEPAAGVLMLLALPLLRRRASTSVSISNRNNPGLAAMCQCISPLPVLRGRPGWGFFRFSSKTFRKPAAEGDLH